MVSPIALDAMELARRTSSVVSHASIGVGFGVWHGPDGEGILPKALERMSRRAWTSNWVVDESDHYQSLWTHALASGVFGHGIVMVATRIRDPLTLGSAEDRRTDLTSSGEAVQWYGVERPNPTFMSAESRVLELLVRLPGDVEHVTVADGMALARTLAQVATVAQERDRPVVFAHGPTAPPVDDAARDGDYGRIVDDGNRAAWPVARSFGLRFAIATAPDEVRLRSEIYDVVARHCRSMGAELWIGDHRGDRRVGQWYHAEAADPGRYRRLRRADGEAAARPIDHGIPVTFVGPARVGAVAELVTPLAERGVPLIATSIGALEQVAFIHLVVAAPAPDVPDRAVEPYKGSAATVLGHLVPGAEIELDQAKDHRGVIGPGHPIDRRYDHDGLALWGAWHVHDRPDALHRAITHLRQALDDELGHHGLSVDDVNIEYVVCQRVESGDLLGRCKLAVPVAVDEAMERDPRRRGELCTAVEQAWRRQMAEHLGSALVEVEVAWQEWRLGRWLALLGDDVGLMRWA